MCLIDRRDDLQLDRNLISQEIFPLRDPRGVPFGAGVDMELWRHSQVPAALPAGKCPRRDEVCRGLDVALCVRIDSARWYD